MEIYYCQVCGKKIDSDAIARREAVRSASNSVSCVGCASASDMEAVSLQSPASPPQGMRPLPPRFVEKVRNAEAHPHTATTSPAPSKSSALPVLAFGMIVLLIGAVLAFKGRNSDRATTPAETPTPAPAPAVTTTVPPRQPQPPPPPPQQPKKPVDPETAASDALSDIIKTQKAKKPAAHIAALEAFLKEYPTAMSASRARVELSSAKMMQKLTADGLLMITSFEAGEDWGFHNGAEFPGAKGNMSFDNTVRKDGERSIKISADFSGGGAYVAIGRHVSEGPVGEWLRGISFDQVAGLRLWVRAPKARGISLRLNDNSGQCHQLPQTFQAKDDWQKIEIKSFNSGPRYEHFGGKNDGVFQWPLTAVSILVGRDVLDPEKTGDVWLDQIELILKK